MKVPIRSKLTFCISCSKSFKVHFKCKKYFTEDARIQKKWIRRYLANVQLRRQARFLRDIPRRGKREWKVEWGCSSSHPARPMSAGCTCVLDHSFCSFLHFHGGSFTRAVQFTTSCHGVHLHNSRNTLFMWSAASSHHPKMGFFSGP